MCEKITIVIAPPKGELAAKPTEGVKLKMSVLIINGSPNRSGNTAAVIDFLCKNMENCEVIDCCFANVAHCNGCDGCVNGKCVIDDDMQLYYEKIKNADVIIFASPLYFSMLTGGLLTFASRWQYFFRNKYRGNKKGGVVLIGGGSTKDLTKAYSTASIIMNYVGIKKPEMVSFVNTDNENAMENAKFVEELKNFIKCLLL